MRICLKLAPLTNPTLSPRCTTKSTTVSLPLSIKVGEEQVARSQKGPPPTTEVPPRRQPAEEGADQQGQGQQRSPGHQDLLIALFIKKYVNKILGD